MEDHSYVSAEAMKQIQKAVARELTAWVKEYYEANGYVLQDETVAAIRREEYQKNGEKIELTDKDVQSIEQFVSALQEKMEETVKKHAGGFGTNSIGVDATLVIYTGVYYGDVQSYCESHNGQLYMISHTAADALWNRQMRENIAEVIGETKPTDAITSKVLSGKFAGKNSVRIDQFASKAARALSLDDWISAKVVEAGLKKGTVMYILHYRDDQIPKSVGLKTEVPVLLNQALKQGIDLLTAMKLANPEQYQVGDSLSLIVVPINTAPLYFRNSEIVYADMLYCIGEKGEIPQSFDAVKTVQEVVISQMEHPKSSEQVIPTPIVHDKSPCKILEPQIAIVLYEQSQPASPMWKTLEDHVADQEPIQQPDMGAVPLSKEEWKSMIEAAKNDGSSVQGAKDQVNQNNGAHSVPDGTDSPNGGDHESR